MIPACGEFESLLVRRRRSPLPAAARLEAHLTRCTACATEAEAIEALTLFADLTAGELPAGMAIDPLPMSWPASASRRAPGPARSGPAAPSWLSPIPALASLAGLALLLAAWLSQGDPGTGARPGSAAGTRMALSPAAADPWLDPHAMNDAVATVEEIRSPTAEVFAFTLAGRDGPTEVVLIVDRSIDL